MNNYTRIANEILEALAKIRIPGEARQVLDLILRETFGFQKYEAKLALSYMAKKTGISKPHIIRATQKLVEMNIITVAQKGNENKHMYRFNKQYEKWKPLPKKETVAQKGNGRCPKRKQPLPKKETFSDDPKETLKKPLKKPIVAQKNATKRKLTPLQEFVEYYITKYKHQFDEEPPENWGKTKEWGKAGKLFMPRINQYGVEKLKSLLDDFFSIDDEFIKRTGYTLGVFYSQMSKLITQRKTGGWPGI